MVDERDLRRGVEEKSETRATVPHSHRFDSVVNNPGDPPARKYCGLCGHWEALTEEELAADREAVEKARVEAKAKLDADARAAQAKK